MWPVLLSLLLLFTLSPTLLPQSTNEEFRAIWVVDDQWFHQGTTPEENKALTKQVLDNHVRANMTSVLWQIRRRGTVLYPSAYEPWSRLADFSDPGYDPLSYAIEEAHKRGLEFHAWFNVFDNRLLYEGSPAEKYPEWICRDRDGIPMPDSIAALSPGLPEVREYLINVAMEIVRNYDVDGLHLDFVRWNEYTNSGKSLDLARQNLQKQLPDGIITAEQIRELQNNASGRYLYDVDHPYSAGIPDGFNTWEDWWRWSVTEFVRTLHDSIQAVRPWVRLSPAALGRYNWGGWQGYESVYQDAALWLNERYIDQLVGMHYHWSLPDEFISVLVSGCPSCWSQFIQPAISDGQMYSVGLFSDSFAENKIFGRHPAIIDRVRNISWVDGFQFFSYASWNDQNYWDAAKAQFFDSKAKIRATRLIDDTSPDAPTLSLTQMDSLTYEISVVPASSVQENQWFATYRSENQNPERDRDEIINIHFGSSQFAVIDSFTGNQDFNGQYSYFATTLDRFWNESGVSNAAQSDLIPSFAPTVIATSPAPGDTIPVNDKIAVQFSKTMDTASFDAAVSFDPPIQIAELTWSEDQKEVTIGVAGLFEFATEYTLTIAADAADVNGKALDGNGDGVPGDAFELTFQTLPEDVIGPQVLFSFPDFQTQEMDFPIDGVLTFLFDEMLDESSVNDATVNLKQGEADVDVGFLVSNFDARSVLSVQSLQPLENNQDYTLTLSGAISDTAGNQMGEDVAIHFNTSAERYAESEIIDQFFSVLNWWQPNQSGSTVGIVVPNTTFEMSTEAYLPSVPRRQRISPRLQYQWDESASEFLIRVYLPGGPPQEVEFDTTYVLQVHLFGDGSGNKFRFAIDDNLPTVSAENHEVSNWVTVNWYGWQLVEWPLSDPNSVGIWIGDGVPEGMLRFDSFQFTHSPEDAATGKIFFDNLRLVKKTTTPVSVASRDDATPHDFRLAQNYPNPFNPTTTIEYAIPEDGMVQLTIFNMLGREVQRLVNGPMKAGTYRVRVNASDLASGMYVYRLTLNHAKSISKRMLLMK